MPFPLRLANRRIDDPRALATLVVGDAEAGGGQVIPDTAPVQWVYGLVREGQLEHPLAIGLAAALLRSGRAAAVAVGARLAASLEDADLHELFLPALDGLDVGVLLTEDPCRPGASVEDALLRGWAQVAPLWRDPVRAQVLERLRRAGLHDVELGVLCRFGSAEELERWLADALTGEASQWPAIAAGLVRMDGVQERIATALTDLPLAQRQALWKTACELHPALAGRGRLRVLAGL